MCRLALISFLLLLGNLCYCQGVFSGGVIPDKLEPSGDLLSPPPLTLPEVSSNEHRNIWRSEDFILTAPRDPIQEMDLSPDRTSGTAWSEPKSFDPVKGDLERFMRSPCWGQLGYNPLEALSVQEEKYRNCEKSYYRSSGGLWQYVLLTIIIIIPLGLYLFSLHRNDKTVGD